MERRCATGFLWPNPKEKNHLEELEIEGRVTLYYIIGKYVGRVRTGLSWLRILTHYFSSSINKNVAAV